MKRAGIVFTCIFLLSLSTASNASATYITIENTWTSAPLLQAGLGGPFSFITLSIRLDEFDLSTGLTMCSSDYCDPTSVIPLDVTNANPIGLGETFTSQLLPGVPETQFFFSGLGVAGAWGFTGVADVSMHYVIQPGVAGSDTVHVMWPYPDPAPVNNPYYPIGSITFHPGAPPTSVPDLGSSLLLLCTGLAGLLGISPSRTAAPKRS